MTKTAIKEKRQTEEHIAGEKTETTRITLEQVAQRAYEIWQECGCNHMATMLKTGCKLRKS